MRGCCGGAGAAQTSYVALLCRNLSPTKGSKIGPQAWVLEVSHPEDAGAEPRHPLTSKETSHPDCPLCPISRWGPSTTWGLNPGLPHVKEILPLCLSQAAQICNVGRYHPHKTSFCPPFTFDRSRNSSGDFPGSPVVKIPHFQCRGCGFNPWLGY